MMGHRSADARARFGSGNIVHAQDALETRPTRPRRAYLRLGKARGVAALLLGLLCVGPLLASSADRSEAQTFPFRFYSNRGGDFELTDQQGLAWNLASQRGKVVLLTFGYTQCPDICPMTLSNVGATWRALDIERREVQGVFITLDPDRDTPQRLTAYLANMESPVIGLTGSVDAIRSVAQQYRVKYEVRDGGSSVGAMIDHSAFIYMIDRQGRVRYLFPHTIPSESLAEAARQLLKLAP